MLINEQLSPCFTRSMNWCHMFAGTDVQERTSPLEAEVSELPERPGLRGPETRGLRAAYWRDRPEVPARHRWDPCLRMCLGGWRDLLAGFKQAASMSRIRPFLLFVLTSVVFPCNVPSVKALPFGNLWVVDSVYRRRMCVHICLWWHNRKDNSFRSCSPLDSVGP